MLRFLLAVVGLVQLIAPERVVRAYTRLAYEGPEAFRVRRWVVPAMRLEGIVMLYLAVKGADTDGNDSSRRDQATRAKASVPLTFST